MVFTCIQVDPLLSGSGKWQMAKSVRLQIAGCDSVLFDFNYFYGKDVQTDSIINP